MTITIESFLQRAPDQTRRVRFRYGQVLIYLPNYVEALVLSSTVNNKQAEELLFSFWIIAVEKLGKDYSTETASRYMEFLVLDHYGLKIDFEKVLFKESLQEPIKLGVFLENNCSLTIEKIYIESLLLLFGVRRAKIELKTMIEEALGELKSSSFSLAQGRCFTPRNNAVQRYVSNKIILSILLPKVKRIKIVL